MSNINEPRTTWHVFDTGEGRWLHCFTGTESEASNHLQMIGGSNKLVAVRNDELNIPHLHTFRRMFLDAANVALNDDEMLVPMCLLKRLTARHTFKECLTSLMKSEASSLPDTSDLEPAG